MIKMSLNQASCSTYCSDNLTSYYHSINSLPCASSECIINLNIINVVECRIFVLSNVKLKIFIGVKIAATLPSPPPRKKNAFEPFK